MVIIREVFGLTECWLTETSIEQFYGMTKRIVIHWDKFKIIAYS